MVGWRYGPMPKRANRHNGVAGARAMLIGIHETPEGKIDEEALSRVEAAIRQRGGA